MTHPTIGTVAMGDTEAAETPTIDKINRLIRDLNSGAILGYDGPAQYWSTRMGAEASIEVAHLLTAALSTRPAQEPVEPDGRKPYGYTVELRACDQKGGDFYITRSRVQKHMGVAEACVAHWKTIYSGAEWRFRIVPLFEAAPQPVLSQPEVKALSDWERSRLLQYAAANALNYMGHHAKGGLKPDEIEDMERWKSLSDKLKALCPLSDIPAQAGEDRGPTLAETDAANAEAGAAAISAILDGPHPSHNGCVCSCHRGSGIIHFVACCSPSTPPVNAMGNKTGGERI